MTATISSSRAGCVFHVCADCCAVTPNRASLSRVRCGTMPSCPLDQHQLSAVMHLVLFDGEEHFEAALRRLATWHQDALT